MWRWLPSAVSRPFGRKAQHGISNSRAPAAEHGDPESTPPGSTPRGGPAAESASDAEILLTDKRWLDLVEDCILLFDELAENSTKLDASGQAIAEHACDRLQEILARSGVEIISGDTAFDPSRHKTASPMSDGSAGSTIADTLRPGFAVGRRVLRRADVTLKGAHSS